MVHSTPQASWVSSKDESREMMALWPDVVRDLTEAGRHLDIPDVTRWIAKVFMFLFIYLGKKWTLPTFSQMIP